MGGITPNHWQCRRCRMMIGKDNRFPFGEVDPDYYHLIPRRDFRGEAGYVFNVDYPEVFLPDVMACGPIEPVLLRDALDGHLDEKHMNDRAFLWALPNDYEHASYTEARYAHAAAHRGYLPLDHSHAEGDGSVPIEETQAPDDNHEGNQPCLN